MDRNLLLSYWQEGPECLDDIVVKQCFEKMKCFLNFNNRRAKLNPSHCSGCLSGRQINMADYGRSSKYPASSSYRHHHHHHYLSQTPSLRRSPFSLTEEEGYSSGFRQFDKGSVGRISLERVIEESGKIEAEIETETVNSVFQFSDKNMPQFAASSPVLSGYSPEFLCTRHRGIAVAQQEPQETRRDANILKHENLSQHSHENQHPCPTTASAALIREVVSSSSSLPGHERSFQPVSGPVATPLTTFMSGKGTLRIPVASIQLSQQQQQQQQQRRLPTFNNAISSVPQPPATIDRRPFHGIELLTSSGLDCPCPLHHGNASSGHDNAQGARCALERGKFSNCSTGVRMNYTKPDIYPDSECNIWI